MGSEGKRYIIWAKGEAGVKSSRIKRKTKRLKCKNKKKKK